MSQRLWSGIGMGVAALPLLSPAFPVGAQSSPRAPLSFETFLSLQIAGDPRPSPDGAMVAYTISVPSLQENRNVSRIWVVPTAGGPARAVTSGPGTDFAPRWSPDGRSIAFISTRAAGAQVWQVPAGGGTATRLTNLESGVNDFLWAPDGRALFVVSDVKWPAEHQEIDQRNGSFPTQARIWTDLMYRHWNEWRVGVRSHLLRVGIGDSAARDLTPFDHDVPPIALGGADIALAPDGTELAIVYNPDRDIAQSTNNDVWVIPAAGGAPVQITTRRGNDHSPAFSPDGTRIAYLSMETPGFESDRTQLMIYDRATRQHRSVTAGVDNNVHGFAWTRDGKLVAEIEERGRVHLYALDPASGRRTRLAAGGVISATRTTATGDLVFLRQSATAPPAVFAARADGGGLRQLGSHNDAALAALDLAPLEEFGFVGALDDSVFAWLLKPPAFTPGRRYPVIYVVHGGPQVAMLDAWSARWNYHMFASRGYVVAAVNFHGSPGWGQRFVNSISKHWGDYPFEDLMKGLDVVAALPYVDSTRMGAAGASYGGYMINWMQGHTDRFKVLFSHDGIFNLASAQGATEELWFPNWEFGPGGVTNPETRAMLDRWSPHLHADKWKTPMLIVHGQQDYRLDVSEGFQAFTALRVRNVPAKFLYFPDEGHWVLKPRNRRLWWGTVLDWMDEYLKKGPGA
jgi:dipeptidyl aminopeptidase/acylaminoacyl peptidase